jgi:hypothetical protein
MNPYLLTPGHFWQRPSSERDREYAQAERAHQQHDQVHAERWRRAAGPAVERAAEDSASARGKIYRGRSSEPVDHENVVVTFPGTEDMEPQPRAGRIALVIVASALALGSALVAVTRIAVPAVFYLLAAVGLLKVAGLV